MIFKIISTLLVLLVVVFILWCAFLKWKPVISFYLFIGDLIATDFKAFAGFGFWLFCGLGGSGKTLSMVEYLSRIRVKYPYVKIYTNFRFDEADGFIDSWRDILDLENYDFQSCDVEEYLKLAIPNRYTRSGRYYKKIHHGIIFGFDEIHLTFASHKWEDAPDNMLEYISQQRKLHKQIVASAQVFTRVDKKLREQTNFVIECKSIFRGRWVFNRYFNTPEYISNDEKLDSGNNKRKRAKRYSFVGSNRLRGLYDTFQVMIDMASGKSISQVTASRIADDIVSRLQ